MPEFNDVSQGHAQRPKAPPPGLLIKKANRDASRFETIAASLEKQSEAFLELGERESAEKMRQLSKMAQEVADSARDFADKTGAFRELSRSLSVSPPDEE